jgi:hypothetical protein
VASLVITGAPGISGRATVDRPVSGELEMGMVVIVYYWQPTDVFDGTVIVLCVGCG